MKHTATVLGTYLLFAIIYTSLVPPSDHAILLLVAVSGAAVGYLVRMLFEVQPEEDN